MQNVLVGHHQILGLELGFVAQRHVNGHLVTVEVRVEGGADQRMKLNGLTLDQQWLEGLDAPDGAGLVRG